LNLGVSGFYPSGVLSEEKMNLHGPAKFRCGGIQSAPVNPSRFKPGDTIELDSTSIAAPIASSGKGSLRCAIDCPLLPYQLARNSFPMLDSNLQNEFLRVFADGHRATAKRIVSKLTELDLAPELRKRVTEIVENEVRGLYHGNLVVLDGGSSLADVGLLKITDDEGAPFATNLHEIGFRYYDTAI
jgi:hypothetical protein